MPARVLLALWLGFLLFSLSCAEKKEDSTSFSLAVVEPEVTGNQLVHYPADNQKVGVNPPGFTWTAKQGARSYRLVIFHGTDTERPVIVLDQLSSTVGILKSPLEPGQYSWYVVYGDSSGRFFGRSSLRNFVVGGDSPELVMPDLARLAAKFKGQRPRIFLIPGQIERIRAVAADGGEPFWRICRMLADSALVEPLYPEPAPAESGREDVDSWRKVYIPAKAGSAHAVRLALMYRLTGERKYLEGAKKWLLNLARWDPDGITSFALPLPDGTQGNTEAAMPLLERMAIAFDWLADELTDEEKATVLSSLRERGNKMLDNYLQNDFLSNPWGNHQGRTLAFLGFAGFACLGELPDAEKWLGYVLRCYLTSYPGWGGDDGGWSQGFSYWSAYVLWLSGFADALRQATDIDIYRKPFFRATGYFPVYFHPPYAKRGAFGDGNEVRANLAEKLLVRKFALAFNDPVLLWQADNIISDRTILANVETSTGRVGWREWFMEDVVAVLSAVPSDLKSEPPTELPGSKWLRDIGWVAMHSALGDSAADVWALFKASRYGSFSHSHSDQNSFQLNAFGEPLIIDSGYYPWNGSPHHNLWTKMTRAHNAVLVGGRGQGTSSMEANGRIEYYEQSGKLTVASGEAARSYNVPLDNERIEQWKEYLAEPLPSMEPSVRTARRTLAFIGSREHPWLVVHDYLETSGPTFFDYLLHSLEKMDIDSKNGILKIKNGQACLKIYLISDAGLSFSQTDRFSVPPEEKYRNAHKDWHFTARTAGQRDRLKFLALFIPYREGIEPLEVKPIESPGIRGFSVGEEKVLTWWGDGEKGVYEGYGEGKPGRLFFELAENGRKTKYFCQ